MEAFTTLANSRSFLEIRDVKRFNELDGNVLGFYHGFEE
jgi:hypothetical protein